MTKPTIEDGIYAEPIWTFEPPRRAVSGTSRRLRVELLLPALKAKAGEWAAVAESPQKHVVQNVQSLFHNGTFGEPWTWEAACRVDPLTRINTLYVRYVAPKATQPSAPAKAAAPVPASQVKRPGVAALLCSCGHASRRHFDSEGMCDSCDCTEYVIG